MRMSVTGALTLTLSLTLTFKLTATLDATVSGLALARASPIATRKVEPENPADLFRFAADLLKARPHLRFPPQSTWSSTSSWQRWAAHSRVRPLRCRAVHCRAG